jgi:hypothetical protein
MDFDPSPASAHGDGSGGAWPFDSLTTSMLFSSVSASPQLPASSSSWLTPPSPLWLFEDRHLLPLDAPSAAPEAAVAAAVVEEVQRARSGEPSFLSDYLLHRLISSFFLFLGTISISISM